MLITSDDSEDDILLHFREAKEEHKPNDEVNVFLYFDKKHRITATEKEVLVTLDNPVNLLEVKEVNPNLGVFLNINTPKDVLYSKDNLPTNTKLWPQVGEKVIAKLKMTSESFLLKRITKNDIVALNKNVNYEEKEIVEAYVHSLGEKGLTAVSVDLMAIFVPTFEQRKTYHIGERVNITITKKMAGWYYGSLIEQKELMIDVDRDLILKYLKAHKVMLLTAKSSSEDIFKIFKISRKAFKRAYGGLYKDGLIAFDDERTWLVNKD